MTEILIEQLILKQTNKTPVIIFMFRYMYSKRNYEFKTKTLIHQAIHVHHIILYYPLRLIYISNYQFQSEQVITEEFLPYIPLPKLLISLQNIRLCSEFRNHERKEIKMNSKQLYIYSPSINKKESHLSNNFVPTKGSIYFF